jgi:hypothetical protein
VDSALAYAALGSGFAVAFVITGVDRIDPHAAGAGWGFRALIYPGAALLWPLLAWRWVTSERRAS